MIKENWGVLCGEYGINDSRFHLAERQNDRFCS